MKTRTVRCTSVYDDVVDDRYCNISLKPVAVANCPGVECFDWHKSEWSQCAGCRRHRNISCRNNSTNSEIDSSYCPIQTRPTNIDVCCHYRWRTKLSGVSVVI